MSEPIKLVAFCGSLRKASFNRMALNLFAGKLPAECTMQTIEIGDWPLYNADIQAQGFPDKVQAAQKAMLAADGIVLVTPEYNYGPSGVLKNAIDWLSRTSPQPFAAKPIALFGASGGLLGAARAQYQLRQSISFLNGTNESEHDGWTILLHLDRGKTDIQGSRAKQLLHQVAQQFSTHVIDIAL